MEKLIKNINKINDYLELSRDIVGIKFIKTEEEFNKNKGRKLPHMMAYCTMVRNAASKNDGVKAKVENIACYAASQALGLAEVTKTDRDGSKRINFGANKDLEVSKKVSENMVYCDEKNYGVNIMPLSQFEEDPDIVIIISNGFNMMRISQGYAYHYGHVSTAQFSGMQAMCQECTSYPYMKDDINISMLCAGTRMLCQWEDDEIAVGMPFSKFYNLVDGIENTINPLERNKNKKIIKEKLDKSKNDLVIKFNENYDDNYYGKKIN